MMLVDTRPEPLVFGTKAETLETLKPLVKSCTVLDLFYFTAEEWQKDAKHLCLKILLQFGGFPVVVRSSAHNEDSANQSLAGAFGSVLNVDGSNSDAIRAAVDKVFASYDPGSPRDQVLIQPMLQSVAVSGVIMTHDLSNGAPYYIINYDDESGKTDVITGGTGVNKTVVVHRSAPGAYVESSRIDRLLEMTRELESLWGYRVPLDIEFAQTKDGNLYLLQVRRIAVQKNWNRAVQTRISEALEHLEQFLTDHARPRPNLAGDGTILGQMPDWNPAELIGTQPRPLSASLFRTLITDRVWQDARASMGYRPVPQEPLMLLLAGRPYIDVRSSFNSFLPAGLDPATETRLVNGWLQRLASRPELHDKVEFQVAQTVMDFTFERDFQDRYGDILSAGEYHLYKEGLRDLTKRNLAPGEKSSLQQALATIETLRQRQEDQQEEPHLPPLRRALQLLQECRRYGTLQFSIIARHAFIAETLLRSAIRRGAWTPERMEEFKRSITSIGSQLGNDFSGVVAGVLSRELFLLRYGHLRPGTFDILSPRYDQREDLFSSDRLAESDGAEERTDFGLTPRERADFGTLLAEVGASVGPDELLLYAERAIAGREYAKFIFTRHLSNAMESLAEWGDLVGLSREQISYLTLHDLAETLHEPVTRDLESYFNQLAEARRSYAREMRGLRLSYLLRDVHDLYVIPLHRSAANFVTTRSVEAEVALLDNRMVGQGDLQGKIVCIQSADPGFDWVFTRGIAGLVTEFGGANSHMTIRCAELGIPAAIGVGEHTFERLSKSGRIELRCGEKVVRPIYG